MSLSLIVEMGWKSALIAGAALLVVALLRSRSAEDRAAVLRLGVGLLLLLPLIALAVPALEVETPAAVPAVAVAPAPVKVDPLDFVAPAEARAPAVVTLLEAGSSIWTDTEFLIAFVYLAGLLAIGLRLSSGLLTLRLWTENGRAPELREWTDALARLDTGGRAPRLLVSEDVPAPLSWGWRRPVILIDEDSHERVEDAEAILAHEMAHIARSDWPALLLARAAVALFWFNPLVWLMAREVAQQAEEAADSHALSRVEAAHYAQTLVSCAHNLVAARIPANSIAPARGRLARRIKAILEGRRVASGSRWTRIAMIGCAGFAAPVAALELIPAALPAPRAPAAPAAPKAPVAPVLAAAVAQPVPPAAPAAPVRPAPPTARPGAEEHDMQVDIDEAAIERAAEQAARSAERAGEEAERIGERVAAAVERDLEGLEERIARDVERRTAHIDRHVERQVAVAMKAAALAHAAGAVSMMHGADQMEAGARQMDKAARDLASPAFREREIARAARQGRIVTHQQLIDAIPGMRQGADEMRRGAKEMRQSAKEMRRQRT